MPAPEISFLVQGPDGRCRTVTARTARGALRRFLFGHPREVQHGDIVSIKPRGAGDWTDFRVTR